MLRLAVAVSGSSSSGPCCLCPCPCPRGSPPLPTLLPATSSTSSLCWLRPSSSRILTKSSRRLTSSSRRLTSSSRVGRRTISCQAAAADEAASSSSRSMFGSELPLSGPHKFLGDLPASARYTTCAVIVAAALAAGYAVGARAGNGTPAAAVGGAVALGTAGGAIAFALNAAAPRVAATHLHNALVNLGDPEALTRDHVDSVLLKFGVSRQDEAIAAELRTLYDRFVTGIIPPGNEELKGDEADQIVDFKNALGLEDPDAASVHIEVGRRLFRQRLETGDREAAVEERRAFQKLVYVSTLVFGEASKFLLPWKRVFKITDAQVDVAVRDNAQRLFLAKLDSISSDIQSQGIVNLREAQLRFKLTDEVTADLFRAHARKQIEEYVTSALQASRARSSRLKDLTKVTAELDKVLNYNASLSALAEKLGPSSLPGLGPASLLGGQYDSDKHVDDLKQLYTTYLTDAFSAGRLEEHKISALNQLKNVFGLGNRQADDILQDVTIKVYRQKLSQAVKGGDLDAAPSKAVYLQNLCDTLQLDPLKAQAVHEDIYRQKLEQCVAGGKLSDADVAALLRLRVLLCIPQEKVDEAHASICGRLFAKVVDDAIGAGVDGYDADMKEAVRNAVTGLRISVDAALSIATKAVKAILVTYIKRSRSAGSGSEAVRELRKMISFYNLVVANLISDIKGESYVPPPVKTEETVVQEKKSEGEDEDELEELQTLRKTRPDNKEVEAPVTITLRDELEFRERSDLYQRFLIHCLTGETTGMPMGTQIVVQQDKSEFLKLGQLGRILGLSNLEVANIHKGLAEQAFRKQAQLILADGQLSKARMEQLKGLQQQLGLPAEAAQKVIQSITTTRMSGAIETAINQGTLSLEEVKELKEAGFDIQSTISKDVRLKLFKKIVDGIFSSGKGEFSEADVYDSIPTALGLDVKNAKKLVQDLARERLSNSLVQAVALLRQKNPAGVVSSLNNLLACDLAVPSQPLSWSQREELSDLFCIFLKSSETEAKISRLRELLQIDEAVARGLQELVESGEFAVEAEEEFGF